MKERKKFSKTRLRLGREKKKISDNPPPAENTEYDADDILFDVSGESVFYSADKIHQGSDNVSETY